MHKKNSNPDYKKLITKLNSFNIEHLLKFCSYLSLIELYGGDSFLNHRMYNFDNVRVLGDAIIESRSTSYKSKTLSYTDFYNMMRYCEESRIDARVHEIKSGDKRTLYEANKFLSRMANIQFSSQEHISQVYPFHIIAFYDALPSKYINEFPIDQQSNVKEIHGKFEKVLGLPIISIVYLIKKIYQHFEKVYKQLSTFEKFTVDSQLMTLNSKVTLSNKRWLMLFHLFDKIENKMIATKSDFVQLESRISEDQIENFLRIFTIDIETLRKIRGDEPQYKYGIDGWRLSPFERYPIIRTKKDQSLFFIPNQRIFQTNIENILHFTLFDRIGPDYNDKFRGPCQEVYLKLLIKKKLPSMKIIQERTYRNGQNRGPDLILIPPENNRAIIIESKARKLRADTRLDLGEKEYDENLNDVYTALSKLPHKINDIIKDYPEYIDIKPIIAGISPEHIIAISVVGDLPFLVNNLVFFRSQNDSNFPLYHFQYPFCIISLKYFERAVEISASHDISLFQLLFEYWEDTINQHNLSDPAPENLRDRRPELEHSFSEILIRDK